MSRRKIVLVQDAARLKEYRRRKGLVRAFKQNVTKEEIDAIGVKVWEAVLGKQVQKILGKYANG